MEVQNKIGIYNQKLKQIVERNTPGDGIFQTAVPSLFFVRKKQINQTDKCFVKPHVSVVLQGHKISILGNQEYHLEKNKCIVSGVDAKSLQIFLSKNLMRNFFRFFSILTGKCCRNSFLKWKSTIFLMRLQNSVFCR